MAPLGNGITSDLVAMTSFFASTVDLPPSLSHTKIVFGDKGGSSFDVVNFNLLEEKLNALGEALDGSILHLGQMGEVQFDPFDWRRLFFR